MNGSYTDLGVISLDKNELKSLLEAAGAYCIENEPMKKHTTFCIGGNADIYAVPKNIESIAECRRICVDNNIDYVVLGNCSNVVFSDNGYRGVVISTAALADDIELISAVDVKCAAGVKLASLCSFAFENSLSGVECLWGIPGTVGGAVCMNAGAYGGEIKDTLIECECIDSNGNLVKYSADELDLSYRHSRFSDNDEIIVSSTFRLTPAVQSEIREKMDDLMSRRRDKQPLEYPSAGSVFKRPEGYFAAALIDESGLKGESVGDAQISEKHAGFMINKGNATCHDLKLLIEKTKEEVFLRHGVRLECEIKFIGE